MVRLRLALLLVWGLGCTTTETIPTQTGTESEDPDPNTTVPDEPGPSDSSPSEPPNEVPSPQDNGGAGGAAGASGGAGGSPAVELPRSEVIEVSDGSFTPGPPPTPTAESTLAQIVNLAGPPAVTNGGSAILHVQLSPPVPSPTFVVGLSGDTGYHTVTGSDPDGDGTYDISTVVAAGATQTSLTFRVALRDAAGNVGPYSEIAIPVIQSGTGDVKVTLSWDRLHDLDLRVTEPGGEEIRYSNQSSRTGGELDLDSGANCGQAVANSENIFWPSGGGPSGEYVVTVHNYQQCSAGAIDYTLRVVYDNTVTTYRGSFADASAGELDTADNLKEMARFRR
ncbi:MAG: hypothetical protein RL685_4299 [Pseudomonadota bacterium]|jgi:hypothetical protein